MQVDLDEKYLEPFHQSYRFQMIDYESKPSRIVLPSPAHSGLTLDQAVRSISKNVQYLDTLLSQARSLCHDRSADMAAIRLYVMEWGKQPLCVLLNDALKSEGEEALKPWLPYLQLFCNGAERLRKFQGTCWRGTPFNISDRFRSNQKVIWRGINSCSKSLDFILKSCVGRKGTLVKINTINSRDFSDGTLDTITQEVILMPGTTLLVKSVGLYSSDNSITLVELQEINEEKENTVTPNVPKSQVSSSTNSSGKCFLIECDKK